MNRYDFVYFFDVSDGNPNGDPDAGNLPRIDAETGQGLVTDVCLKRKVRNYVELTKSDESGFGIYVQEGSVLNRQKERAWQAVSASTEKAKRNKPSDETAQKLTAWMCSNFYDVRAFGAVMTHKVNCGQVRGPIQLTFGRSIDPIVSSEHTITLCAVVSEEDAAKKDRDIGRKFSVPYAMYRMHGYVNPFLAEQTGFTDVDLRLFRLALDQMFEYDRSAARGLMKPVRCIAFRHESELGNARADQLFGRVTTERTGSSDGRPSRTASDYRISVDTTNLPQGITVEDWVA